MEIDKFLEIKKSQLRDFFLFTQIHFSSRIQFIKLIVF
jgi:hypothetical protein